MSKQRLHHQRIGSNSHLIAEGRLLAYNQLIGFASKLVDRLARDCRVVNPECIAIRILDSSRWWLVYEEDRGHDYWVAMSESGVLIDGWSRVRGGEYVFRRIVKLEAIDSCDCVVAKTDSCYSDDGRLDYHTLKLLCVSLIKLCEKLDLRSFLNLMRKKFTELPIDDVDFAI